MFSAAVDAGQYVARADRHARGGRSRRIVYLRIVLAMYAPADDEAAARGHDPRIASTPAPASRSTIAAAGVLFLGIMPGVMLDFAKHATQLLAR